MLKLTKSLSSWLRGPVGRPVFSVALGLGATLFTPWMLRTDDNLFYTNSVLALVLFVLFAGLFYQLPHFASARRLRFTIPLGLIFSAFMVLGATLEIQGDIAFGSPLLYLAILCNSPIFCALLTALWWWLDNRGGPKNPGNGSTFGCSPKGAAKTDKTQPGPQRIGAGLSNLSKRLGKWKWPLCWLFLLACWLPVLLASWPGFFTNDAMIQYQQFTTGAITGYHPPLHTFLLGLGVTSFGSLLGSINAGITAWLGLQMAFVAACFIRVIHFLGSHGAPRWLRLAGLLYYGLFPTIAMFACCTTKDTLFSACIVLLIIELWQVLETGREEFTLWRGVRLVLAALSVLLLRNNAPWAYLVLVPFVVLGATRFRLRMALVAILPLALYGLYAGPLLTVLGVPPGDIREMLGVPVQQLARVHQRAPEAFSEEQLADLYALIERENLLQYHPKLFDPVKAGFHTAVLENDPARYIALWANVGLRYPTIYINAFLENTVDLWYPDSLVNGYNFEGERERVFAVGGTSYFYALLEPPAQLDSKWPSLLALYESISYEISFQRIPLLSLLFAPAFMVWILLISLCYAWYRRAYRAIVPGLFLLILVLTCLLCPLVQVRYVLYLYFGFPLLLGLLLNPTCFGGNGDYHSF